jgi:serine/threonine-protein phosphatase 2B catalytic subunit
MTSYFNFRTEAISKYDEETYDLFMESFDRLPLCAIVNERFFAVHGGLSPDLKLVSYSCNANS